jgi:hypothetical protein
VGLVDVVRGDKEKCKKWLLLACLRAEKEFGSKTGIIKLRYVYDLFLTTFPILSKFITFEQFGAMVDETLEEMKRLINTNMAVFEFVGGYEIEKK